MAIELFNEKKITFGDLEDVNLVAPTPSTGNVLTFNGDEWAAAPVPDDFVSSVTDTATIDLQVQSGALSSSVVAGSIGSTQLSSAVNSALTLAGTAVQPAALTSYLPLSGGALTGAVTSTSSISSRQSANTVQFLVSSGTAQTIDWNNGGNINLDLSSATGNVTLTLQNPVSGATYRIRVQQGATVRNLTFPAGTVQQGGGGNVYTGIAGVDFLTVYYNGSAYLVQSALNSGFVQPTNNAIFTGVTQAAALRLNTVAVMISSAVPTTRTDGSALVAGDFWLNPNTGTIGFWRSPYWLTAQTYHTADRAPSGAVVDIATAPGLRYANPGAGAELVFVESCWVYRIPGGQNINSGDGSNYTMLRWGYHNINSISFADIHTKNSNTIDNTFRYRFDVNGAYTVTGFTMLRTIVGTVDIATSVRMGVTYRVIL